MMWCWISLLLFAGFLKAQERQIVMYAQVGGTVTLPRQLIDEKSENLYVNWYHGSATPVLGRNPQGGIQKGKDPKTHVTLSQDYSLQISPVDESDFGEWRCEQHILKNEYKHLYILHRVTIPQVPAVIVGGSLSLQCMAETSSANLRYTWIPPKNSGCNLSEKNQKDNAFSQVTRCHSGVWKCKLNYNGKETVATTTVSVIDLSPFDPIYTSETSPSVSIPCSLSSQISWSVLNKTGLQGGSWTFTSLNNQQIQKPLMSLSVGSAVRWDTNDENFPGRELTNHNLSISSRSVSQNISGTYKCSLIFITKSLKTEVKVDVLKVSSSGGSRFHEGQSVNLTCTLGHANTPELQVKWIYPSSSTQPRVQESRHPAVLSISELRIEDSGRWTCELLKNGKMLTSTFISLKIVKAPVNVWLCVAIISGLLLFILFTVIVIIAVRRHKQMMMYRRRKATRFCCCKNPQPKGFYKT